MHNASCITYVGVNEEVEQNRPKPASTLSTAQEARNQYENLIISNSNNSFHLVTQTKF